MGSKEKYLDGQWKFDDDYVIPDFCHINISNGEQKYIFVPKDLHISVVSILVTANNIIICVNTTILKEKNLLLFKSDHDH